MVKNEWLKLTNDSLFEDNAIWVENIQDQKVVNENTVVIYTVNKDLLTAILSLNLEE